MSDNNDIIISDNIANNFVVPYNEYQNEYEENEIYGGGIWYYTQNTHGTKWFDIVDNSRGWTVDFNLRVLDVQNNDNSMSENEDEGIGIYINDGTHKEIINFLTQEIVFHYANKSIVFDATKQVDYRLGGKDNRLKLYAKKQDQKNYELLIEVAFEEESTNQANASQAKIFEDTQGNIHSVWLDDGNKKGQIYYSYFENEQWSEPEVIVRENVPVESPDIIIDSDGIVYVSYELHESNYTSINLKYKNDIGWSNPYNIGQFFGKAKNPKMIFDAEENLFIIWINNFDNDNIYITKINKQNFKIISNKIYSNDYLINNFSITSYLDDLYIVFTSYSDVGEQYTSVNIIKYNFKSEDISDVKVIKEDNTYVDNSDIIANVSGNIIVAWEDNAIGNYEIYGVVLNTNLDILFDIQQLTESNGGARKVVLSEQVTTGDVYIVWQDYISNYKEFNEISEYDDEYEMAYGSGEIPFYYNIHIGYFDNLDKEFHTSYNEGYDVQLVFEDERQVKSPTVPILFHNELPIIYNTNIAKLDDNIKSYEMFSHIGFAFYDLDRSSNLYYVTDKIDDSDYIDKNYLITNQKDRKEIRFGDFSSSFNCHYIFNNIKYYLNDSVSPFRVNDIYADNIDLDSLITNDAIVNNYGDVWIVGLNGIYFYLDSANNIYTLGTDEEVEGGSVDFQGPKGDIRSITFDKYNNMFIGKADGSILYSTSHINGFINLNSNITNTITCLTFDKNNNLWVGTENGLILFNINYSFNENEINIELEQESLNELSSNFISSVQVDDNNVIWIGTHSGLYKFYDSLFFQFTTSNRLPSNRINDITIRNTAIRYIATSNGIAKMIGSSFVDTINGENENIWNGNVKSILWQDPNILWAGTLSKINQIIVNDEDDSYSTAIYTPEVVNNDNLEDDTDIYYIVSDDIEIDNNDLIEVYINGNKINFGYNIGFDNKLEQTAIKFDTPLKSNDVVEVVVRKDLQLNVDFEQSDNEKIALGQQIIKIKDIFVKNNDLIISTKGDVRNVKINDSNSLLPFDRVHLDTNPPYIEEGAEGVKIQKQIDKSHLRVGISGATDGNGGSGIEKMIVSNYSNFTTDGITPQTPVDYKDTYVHDIGLTLDENINELSFEDSSLSKIKYISNFNQMWASISQPAILYRKIEDEWKIFKSYGENKIIDFIIIYNNQLVVSVGDPLDVATLYIYDINTLSLINSLYFSESRAYNAVILNNILYIGTGIGEGDEYNDGTGEYGAIYKYDGSVLSLYIENLDKNVYDIVIKGNVDGTINSGDTIFAVTGESGYLYQININSKTSVIIHTDVEALTSISQITASEQDYIYIGNSQKGLVQKSLIDEYGFSVAFQTIGGKVNFIKQIKEDEDNIILYAAIDNVLYYLSDGGWVWRYTHTNNIYDIAIDNEKNIYIISESNIIKLQRNEVEKNIYLSLIDRAGNKSIINTSVATDENPYIDSITINELKNFVNQNKLYEIDNFGNTLYNMDGDSSFYDGNKIEEEKGIYYSEIFDGTSDLVKWDQISWETTETQNTYVYMYVRTSDSKNDILLENWVGPFNSSNANGVDLSHLYGRFIQFKVELYSKVKDSSPVFHKASVGAINSNSVHFFTTNFVLPSTVRKGILTSEKLVPVSADIMFGINDTNSIDWNDYQAIDENRIFNLNNVGKNLRVGIKFISPGFSSLLTSEFDEYGPYTSNLYKNVIDFDINNNSTEDKKYHFKITFYDDIDMQSEVASVFSFNTQDGFSSNGEAISSEGIEVKAGESKLILFNPPGNLYINCGTYYFVKIESTDDFNEEEINYDIIDDDSSFIVGCNTSFIDDIDFNYTNNDITSHDYYFRIRFYNNPERTNLYKTILSGNDTDGWYVDNSNIDEDGNVFITPAQEKSLLYKSNISDFEYDNIYYLIIDATYDGSNYDIISNSYTFKVRDLDSEAYCGEYSNVPIVKNFGIMLELENNEFMRLEI